MKKVLFFFFFIHGSSLFAQKFDPGHLAQNNLTGMVKLCVDSATYWIDSLFFDRNGYLIVEKNWSPYRKKLSVTTNTYKDTLVDKRTYQHDGETDTYEYHYDSLNRCTLETINGEKYVITKYNARGNVTDYFVYSDQPYRTRHMTLTYDDQNRKLETNMYYEDSILNSRTTYSYNDSGYIHVNYSFFDTAVWVYVKKEGYSCDYTFNHFLSPSTLYLKNERWINSHGFTDQLREELNTKEGENHAKHTGTFVGFTYYQYEYDSQGNWIKRVATGVSNHTDKRFIEYYKP